MQYMGIKPPTTLSSCDSYSQVQALTQAIQSEVDRMDKVAAELAQVKQVTDYRIDAVCVG
jgi:hypothetical protein